jgi:hypothetical protein
MVRQAFIQGQAYLVALEAQHIRHTSISDVHRSYTRVMSTRTELLTTNNFSKFSVLQR